MIELTQLSTKTFWLNPHQIEYIEKNPDTTLIMLSGKRIVVIVPDAGERYLSTALYAHLKEEVPA